MENEHKHFKGIYWIKYIVFWITFGAIFEMIELNFNMGIAVALCVLLFDRKKDYPVE